MADVSIRDLRNRGGDIVDRATRGETVIITRNGEPVAELHPLSPAPLSREALMGRMRALPAMDPEALRRDIGEILDGRL